MKVKLQLLDKFISFPSVLYCGDGHQVAALMTWKGDVPSLAVVLLVTFFLKGI